MIEFLPEQHTYRSTDADDINWISATSIITAVKEPFAREEKAKACSIKKPGRWPNKWYGISPEDILAAWDKENKRATDLGHWYHDKKEKQLLKAGIVDGLPVIWPVMAAGIKQAPDQKLQDGIYPEHMVYLQSAGICGQADIVKVQNDVITIRDYKTSKEITTAGFKNWEGDTKKMLPPVHHLDDCHLNHYSIQLSLYMYIMLRHNPNLIAGDMYIDHVKFKEAGRDQYDYPITLLDENGEPVVESVEEIKVKYMRKEIVSILEWMKDQKNREKILQNKKK